MPHFRTAPAFLFLTIWVPCNTTLAEQTECPLGMARIKEFCIDRYEAPNQKGAKPLVARTAIEAENWCKDHGKELCEDRQWQQACEGDEKRAYPYGKTHQKRACNDYKSWLNVRWDLVAKYSPLDAAADPCITDYIESLNQAARSGEHSKCVTPEGVHDLTGNAAEWVRNSTGVVSRGKEKVAYSHNMRGCYWAGCFGGKSPRCTSNNPNHPSHFRTYEAGFRCCKKL